MIWKWKRNKKANGLALGFAAVLVLFTVFTGFTGCGNDEELLVGGRWVEVFEEFDTYLWDEETEENFPARVAAKNVLEFFSDGRLISSREIGHEGESWVERYDVGTWTSEGDRLILSVRWVESPARGREVFDDVYDFEISGSTLTLTGPWGEVQVFNRE